MLSILLHSHVRLTTLVVGSVANIAFYIENLAFHIDAFILRILRFIWILVRFILVFR